MTLWTVLSHILPIAASLVYLQSTVGTDILFIVWPEQSATACASWQLLTVSSAVICIQL